MSVMLEAFCERKGLKVKNKFGVVGLGQYGNKIADLFASLYDDNGRPFYDVVAVNSFVGDFIHLKNIPKDRKLGLKGVEDGCGRNPMLAKEALAKNKENQKMLVDAFSKYLSDCDIYFVCAGLGGGTGTGTIAMTIRALNSVINKPLLAEDKKPKSIGAIVTLPLATAPAIEKRNALTALIEIEKLMRDDKICNFIIIVDNEKAFRDYKKMKESSNKSFDGWMSYSNNNVVQVIHEMNVATNFNSDRSFDPRDFRNIFEHNIGCITFGKHKFPITDVNNDAELFKHTLEALHEKNVLANGFDLKKSRQAGVLIVKPTTRKGSHNIVTVDSVDEIEVGLAKEMPDVLGRYAGYVDWQNPDEAIIYTIAKVEEFPKRAKEELAKEYNEASQRIKASMSSTEFKTSITGIDDSIFSFDNKPAAALDDDPFAMMEAKPKASSSTVNLDDDFTL